VRVALVLTASTGGIGRHVASLVPRLLAQGHDVRIFCPELTARAQDFAALDVVVLGLSALGRARHADVLHAHGYKAGALAALAGVGGPPLVVTWHNAVLGRGRAAVAGRILQRAVARAADLTLGASSDLVAEAVRLGARAARLGPVAAPVLPSPASGREESRRALGLAPDAAAVLTVSRLAPQKNLGLVLDIAAAVPQPGAPNEPFSSNASTRSGCR
jgi:glycosyltransferase involved in cell wall biosynthesis